MILFIIGIIVTIALFISMGFKEVRVETNDYRGYEEKIVWKVNKKQFAALVGVLICLTSFVTKVPANSVGIVYSPFGGTKDTTLSEGFHVKTPFDKVYMFSTEVQSISVTGVTTQTKDAQYVTSALDIKYKVDPSNAFVVFKQYRELDKLTNTMIAPTTQRVLELITTEYNVFDILGERRGEVYSKLEAALTTEFEEYGIEFHSVSIVDMDAGAAIEKAVEQEAIAKKSVETAEQNLLKAQTEAKEQSVQAQAKQDAAKIEAETKLIQAEAEKKANDLLNQSLTDQVLQKEWIDKWDGKMPTYYAGSDGGAGVILDMGE